MSADFPPENKVESDLLRDKHRCSALNSGLTAPAVHSRTFFSCLQHGLQGLTTPSKRRLHEMRLGFTQGLTTAWNMEHTTTILRSEHSRLMPEA